MTDSPSPPVQLLLYGFDAHARFEGRLVGALERIESGGAMRIVEAFFISRDAETEALVAVDLRSRGAGSLVLPLLDFRLDPRKQRRETERALGESGDDDGQRRWIRDLGARLEPGAAVAALLVEHTWTRTLEDAIAETGGRPLGSEFVDAASLADVAPVLLAATSSRGG
jgi:hypothetical protein